MKTPELTDKEIYQLLRIPCAMESRQTPHIIKSLSYREMEILAEAMSGRTNIGIAESLKCSTNTVKRHLESVYMKLLSIREQGSNEFNQRARSIAIGYNYLIGESWLEN